MVCEICMCLARGRVECGVRGLGLSFNPVGTGSLGSVLGLWWFGVCEWHEAGFVRLGWCYVCVQCESGLFAQSRHILGAPSVQSCCSISICASYHQFVCVRYRKSILACMCLSDLD